MNVEEETRIMNLTFPHLRAVAVSGVAACACAAWLEAYYGASFFGTAVMVSCWLLFLFAWMIHPSRREIIASALPGTLFSIMRVMGFSYDTVDSYGLILKNAQTLKNAALAMLALALAATAVILLLLVLMRQVAKRAAREEDVSFGSRRAVFLLCAVIIFAGSVPYLMLYAPGLNIYDTHDQILQFFGFPSYIGDGSALSDHHPVFLTVVYGGFMKLGLLLGDANIGQMAYSFVSMTAIAVCYAWALTTLYDVGLSRRAVLVLAAAIALYPVLALYAFNMCKDVSVEPFVLLFIAQMIRLERSRGEAIKSPVFAMGLFLTALLLMLTRKPSMYALLFAAFFLILRYRGVRRRLAAVLLGAVALFEIGYVHLLLPACGVIPGETREMLSIPFQQSARYLITYGDDLSPEEEEAIARVIDIEYAKANYDPRLSDPVKDTTNPEMDAEDLKAYFSAWLSMGLRHPGVYLDAWLNMIYGYFYPSDSNTIVCLTLNSPDQGGITLRQDDSLSEARLRLYNLIYYTLRRLPGIGALFYVDTVTWFFLFLLVVLILRGGIGAAAPWMFFVGTLGICMLSPKSGEIRYLMPILYALPLMLGVALLPDESEPTGGRICR